MGNPKLSEINEKKVEEWAAQLRARKCRLANRVKATAGIVRERKKTSVSDSAVAAYSRVLRAFITWCHEKAHPSGSSGFLIGFGPGSPAQRAADIEPFPDLLLSRFNFADHVGCVLCGIGDNSFQVTS